MLFFSGNDCNSIYTESYNWSKQEEFDLPIKHESERWNFT